MHPDGSPLYGYTTEDILPAVVTALSLELNKTGNHARMIVRPHPSEWRQPLHDYVNAHQHTNLELEVLETHSTPEWLAAADAVFGMMTIALLHSTFLKRPTLSVQIGLNESGQDDPCLASQLGYVPLVTDIETLKQACAKLIETPGKLLANQPRHPIPLDGSTAHVYQTMRQLIP
jgi:hypothetical protein